MENDGSPEFEHAFLTPGVAAEWKAPFCLSIAVSRMLVETELESLNAVGVAELQAVAIRFNRKEHILVE